MQGSGLDLSLATLRGTIRNPFSDLSRYVRDATRYPPSHGILNPRKPELELYSSHPIFDRYLQTLYWKFSLIRIKFQNFISIYEITDNDSRLLRCNISFRLFNSKHLKLLSIDRSPKNMAKFSYSKTRPWLHRSSPTMIAATNTHTHIYTRARTNTGCVLAAVFPVQWRGGRKPVSRLSRYTRISSWEEPMLQERGGEGRGGALHRARDERTNERNEGREEGRGGKRRRRASFRTVLEKVVAYTPHLLTYITLVSPPPSTPTIGRHKLSRYNAAHGTDGRTDGWTAGRPAAATTSSVRPTKWHSPSLPPPPTAPVRLLRSTKLCHGGAHISAEILLLGPDVDR